MSISVVLAMLLEISWEAGLRLALLLVLHPNTPLGKPLCPLPPSMKGTRLRVSCRTGFIVFPILDSVRDGPVSPEKQM